MTKIFTLKNLIGIALILFPALSHAQSSKIFVELGGKHQRSKSNTPENVRISSEEEMQNARIAPIFGFYLNDHLSMGVEYAYSNQERNRISSERMEDFSKNETYDQSVSLNSFGFFSRLYAKKHCSKFNVFIQLKPAFTKSNNRYEARGATMGYEPTYTSSLYESKGTTKIDIYEIDLGLGLSYKIFYGLAAQLNIPSVINHSRLYYDLTDAKQSYTSIFQSTLSNANLSFNYQF
ncbi:hypothetical protein [Sphingobacterium bovistauri]|uniref:Outer membrane protein beta-barrel domain-containing protein n=1 Tax=Sphingobacterium bovistauri TaxID=2781959 RepID=A0ABS7ZAN6_9SPHI|nr:hypothetical protein [Sphingobacterium bovistauri]MCA5006476.1 hypothetical protein [Sphingobacterium bovistauri]